MPVLQWGMLCVLSLLLSIGFLAVHLPAALLLGPMIAGIIFSMRGITLQLPRSAFLAAQAILGCMIAQNLTGSILTTLAANWPIVLAILLVTLLSSAIVGWLLVRYSSLPGNTGAWGSSPGGAAAMVAMAQDYGADIRLVAFMQYLRVLFVAGAAVLVTRMMLGDNAEAVNQQIVWFPPVSINLLLTILLAVVAGTAGCMLRLPSGTMLIPMLAGAVLQSGQLITIELPEWLLAMAYMAFPEGPQKVHTVMKSNGEVDESFHMLLEYGDGKAAFLSGAFNQISSHVTEITGEKGRILIGPEFWHPEEALLLDGDQIVEKFEDNYPATGFQYEILEAQRCLQNKETESPCFTAEETWRIAELIEKTRKEWGIIYQADKEEE